MATTSPLDRYRDRAERAALDGGSGITHENLVAEIQRAIHEFVAHDVEWCALAVEEFARSAAALREEDALQLAAVVASIRERGR